MYSIYSSVILLPCSDCLVFSNRDMQGDNCHAIVVVMLLLLLGLQCPGHVPHLHRDPDRDS